MPKDPGAASTESVAKSRNRPPLITARNAVENLSPFVGGPPAARRLLIDQWRSGEVNAYARYRWESRGDLRAAWAAGPPDDTKPYQRVPASLLRNSPQLSVDAESWNWRSGRFFLKQRPLHGTRMILLQDVRFVSSDIGLLVDALNPKKGAGGRPTDTQAWTEFWMEVVRMALTGELTKETQVNREQFRHDLIHRLGWDNRQRYPKPPLAADTLKLPTGKVWDRFIEPKPDK